MQAFIWNNQQSNYDCLGTVPARTSDRKIVTFRHDCWLCTARAGSYGQSSSLAAQPRHWGEGGTCASRHTSKTTAAKNRLKNTVENDRLEQNGLIYQNNPHSPPIRSLNLDRHVI
jgi:hypothetical protein